MPQNKTFEKKPFGSSNTDLRVAAISMFIAILFHFIIFAFAPKNFTLMANDNNQIEDFDMEFEVPEIENIIYEIIEANPIANDEKPKNDTPFESFKDQTAKQENLDVSQNSNLPKIDGQNDDSNKIVSGNLQEEVLTQSAESVFETIERPLTNPSKASETNKALENLEEKIVEEKSLDGDLPKEEEVSENSPKENQMQEIEEVEELPMPKPRPHLSLQTAAGPLKKNNLNANAIGITAVDSRFSEFGAYEQRMTEAIARQWYLLASMQSLSSERDTQVVIEFFLNTNGEITSIKVLFNSSTITGKTLCEQAILSTAPYGKWTPEMIAVFGSQNQSVKFTFYYK